MSNHTYETRLCVDCGKQLVVRKDSHAVRCPSCRAEKRRKDVGAYIICANCGKSFQRKRATTKFCSKDCAIQFRHKQTTMMLRCDYCGKEFERHICHIKPFNFCSRECQWKWTSKHTRMENHHNWHGGKYLMGGYVWINLGNGVNIQEHRLVAEKMLGRKLLPGEIVHHIDMNKTNNDPSNLMVVTRREHRMIHDDLLKRSRGLSDHASTVEAGVGTAEVWVVEP